MGTQRFILSGFAVGIALASMPSVADAASTRGTGNQPKAVVVAPPSSGPLVRDPKIKPVSTPLSQWQLRQIWRLRGNPINSNGGVIVKTRPAPPVTCIGNLC